MDVLYSLSNGVVPKNNPVGTFYSSAVIDKGFFKP